jgi:hypothetical protein
MQLFIWPQYLAEPQHVEGDLTPKRQTYSRTGVNKKAASKTKRGSFKTVIFTFLHALNYFFS